MNDAAGDRDFSGRIIYFEEMFFSLLLEIQENIIPVPVTTTPSPGILPEIH
jgi:hypothetical protein